jgi:hypothetical protein
VILDNRIGDPPLCNKDQGAVCESRRLCSAATGGSSDLPSQRDMANGLWEARQSDVFCRDSQTDPQTDAYIEYMRRPRCMELHRVLKKTGSFYYRCDWHASRYVKVMIDWISGRFENSEPRAPRQQREILAIDNVIRPTAEWESWTSLPAEHFDDARSRRAHRNSVHRIGGLRSCQLRRRRSLSSNRGISEQELSVMCEMGIKDGDTLLCA